MTRILFAAALVALSSTAFAQSVTVTLTEWKVALSRDTVSAGPVTFKINNAGTMDHGFYVRGDGVDEAAPTIQARQAGTLKVTLKPGTYEVFCPMSDLSHKQAGMATKLVVTAAGAPASPRKPE